MIENEYINKYLKRERRENTPDTQKTVDNSYSPRYNEDSRTTTYDLNDVWKKSNEKALRYAGDSAKESVDNGLKKASDFMKDAPEGTDYGKVQSAAVKWSLAHDTNNKELQQSAFDELTGLLSTENKEQYLKKARPLQEFVDAKDTFDYKRKNYTTTKNANKGFSVTTYDLQQFLNKEGYTDKFGNTLKEDGIFGAKTAHAHDQMLEAQNDKSSSADTTEQPPKVIKSTSAQSATQTTAPAPAQTVERNNRITGVYGTIPLSDFDDKLYKPQIQTPEYYDYVYHPKVRTLSPEDEVYTDTKKTLIKNMSTSWWKRDGNDEKQKKEQDKIATQGVKLRKFNDSTFNRAIFLNNSSGAGNNGHSAVMLMNGDDYAMIFSFYSTTKNIVYSTFGIGAEMRFSVLTPKQANRVLYGDGWAFDMVSSDGEIEHEEYDRFAYFDIKSEDGIKMYNFAVGIFDDPGKYYLFERQCDDIATAIFKKGGIEIESKIRPNDTYDGIKAHKWERKVENEK